MLTRRIFSLATLGFCFGAATGANAVEDPKIDVRIRADQTARAVLAPIEQANLAIQPDNSEEAKALAERVPPGRAIPILVIIAGAIAVTELLKMIKELYRQTYYGGVLIDTRTQPPTITNDLKIPASMVFVIDGTGKTTQYSNDQFSLDVLKAALVVK
jgi:hypothetical protein